MTREPIVTRLARVKVVMMSWARRGNAEPAPETTTRGIPCLVFGLDGRMEKVADRERTFLLQPAGMDLTEAEVRDAVTGAFRR